MASKKTTAQPATRFITVKQNPSSGSLQYDYANVLTNPSLGLFAANVAMQETMHSVTQTAAQMLSLMNPFLFGNVEKQIQKEHDAQLHAPDMAERMIAVGLTQGGDDAVTQKLHGRLFTHNYGYTNKIVNESLNQVEIAHLRALVATDRPSEGWPNIILTSSHAKVADHADVAEPMEGFRSLIRHSFGTSKRHVPPLELIQFPDAHDKTEDDRKRTVMVAAVDNAPIQNPVTRKMQSANAWINGGRLIYRLNTLKALDERMRSQKLSQDALEDWYVHGDPSQQGEAKGGIAEASVVLAKTMLALLVDDPTAVIESKTDEAVLTPKKPLRLRADADKVMQHMKLVGYSRGGSIVTDAERLLILQLQHKGAVVDAEGQPLHDGAITELMQHTGIVCVNPGIYPLSGRDQALGMRRVTIRSGQDEISAHFFNDYAEKFQHRHDTVYVVPSGTHDIKKALGTPEKLGYILDDSGWELNKKDKEAIADFRSHMQAFFASCHEKVGVSHVYAGQDAAATGCALQFSAGVSDALIQAALPKIKQALEAQGLQHVHVEVKPRKEGAKLLYALHYDAKPDARQHVANALNSLHGADIFVSNTVYQDFELGAKPQPIKQVQAGNGASLHGGGVLAALKEGGWML